MEYRLVTLSDMWHLPVPDQLFSYADAYKDSSATLAQKMWNDPKSFTWPHASVVLMLAAHSVELFLKGALLKRNPAFKVWDHGHNLDSLGAAYRSQFPEPIFEWDIPFASSVSLEEWVATMMRLNPTFSETELREEKSKYKPTPPSILYRYPVDRSGNDWQGLYGFEPVGFINLLSQLGADFDRIKSHLA